MVDYPEGAIRTRAEIEELSRSGKAIYQVVIDEADLKPVNVKNMRPFRIVSYDAKRSGDMCRIEYDSQVPGECAILTNITLSWRNIGSLSRNGFLFTNYFHALAYDLQMKQKQSKKP